MKVDIIERVKKEPFKLPEGVKSQNQQLSEDLNKTVEVWKTEGFNKYIGDLSKLPTQNRLRYIALDKSGKPQARIGGLLIKNDGEKKYLTLKNLRRGIAFSVQYANLQSKEFPTVGVYVGELRETKKKQHGAEVPPPAPKPQINKEAEIKKLSKLYYEGYFVGRDKLFSIAKDKEIQLTRNEIDKWLKNQELYQLTKQVPKDNGLVGLRAKDKFKVLQIDLVDYDEYFILSIVDIFTRYAFTKLLNRKTDTEVLAGVKETFTLVKKRLKYYPSILSSDSGTEFKNAKLEKFCKQKKCKQLFGLAGRPQSQGFVEKFNGTIKTLLKKYLMSKGETLNADNLKTVTHVYNTTPHSTLGMSPIEAYFEENEQAVKESYQKLQKPFKTKYNISVGDKVRLAIEKDKIRKSDIKYTKEIFTVHKVVWGKGQKPAKYKVKDEHGEVLKGYLSYEQLQKIDKVENTGKTPDVYYIVEKLLKKRKYRGQVQYFVKWKGYPHSENTFEPREKLLEDVPDMVNKFDEEH